MQDNYFKDFAAWYPLGASSAMPTSGGLGEYIQNNLSRLTPRHTSVVAAIMVRKNLIECRGKNPIELRKKHGITTHKTSYELGFTARLSGWPKQLSAASQGTAALKAIVRWEL